MSTRLRVAAAALLGLAMLAPAGCSHSPDPAADGCSPGRPHVSQDVARAGDRVVVSVGAVTCTPTFDHGGELVLTFRDGAGRRTRLATVHAHPSGAFEREVVIPRTAAAGGGDLSVSGVETPCADTGSCAADATSVEVVDSAPDFGASGRANQVAAELARHMDAALRHRSAYLQIAIVADGVEVAFHSTRVDAETAVVRRAFASAAEAVPPSDRTTAAAAHLHLLRLQHGRRELRALSSRIGADLPWLREHRIAVTRWSIDTASDSVRLGLRTYSDTAARLLLQRYGSAVSVEPQDAGGIVPT